MRGYCHHTVVGEVLGPEALQLLMAMAAGHPGIATVPAQSPSRLFDRLSLAEAVDVVAYIERFADGSRKISLISEIEDFDGKEPVLRPLFRYVAEKVTAEAVEGDFWLENEPSDRLRAKLARWGVLL